MQKFNINGIHHWTETAISELLTLIANELFLDSESFEKPTDEAFYERIKSKSMQLSGIDFSIIKDKVYYLRISYYEARKWKDSIDAGFIRESDRAAVENYIKQKCQHYYMLEHIFGCQENIISEDNSTTTTAQQNDDCELAAYKIANASSVDSISEPEVLRRIPLPAPSERSKRVVLRKRKSLHDSLNVMNTKKILIEKEKIEMQREANDKRLEFDKLKHSEDLEFNEKKLEFEQKKLVLEEKRLILEQQNIQSRLHLKELETTFHKEIEILKIQSAERLKMKEIEIQNSNRTELHEILDK